MSERTHTNSPPISFSVAQHQVATRFGLAEVSVILTTLKEWSASPLASDPHWIVTVTPDGPALCAIRLDM